MTLTYTAKVAEATHGEIPGMLNSSAVFSVSRELLPLQVFLCHTHSLMITVPYVRTIINVVLLELCALVGLVIIGTTG